MLSDQRTFVIVPGTHSLRYACVLIFLCAHPGPSSVELPASRTRLGRNGRSELPAVGTWFTQHSVFPQAVSLGAWSLCSQCGCLAMHQVCLCLHPHPHHLALSCFLWHGQSHTRLLFCKPLSSARSLSCLFLDCVFSFWIFS